jgi:hypothetical protein
MVLFLGSIFCSLDCLIVTGINNPRLRYLYNIQGTCSTVPVRYHTYFAVVRVIVLLVQKISVVWHKTLSCQHCFQLLQNKTKILTRKTELLKEYKNAQFICSVHNICYKKNSATELGEKRSKTVLD